MSKPFIRDVSRLVARAAGFRWDEKREALAVGGCGMDMGFHVVYSLARALYHKRDGSPGWQCIGKHCPSNDHTNGDRNYEPHPHSDGGYALTQRWI